MTQTYIHVRNKSTVIFIYATEPDLLSTRWQRYNIQQQYPLSYSPTSSCWARDFLVIQSHVHAFDNTTLVIYEQTECNPEWQ